jgi:hypothetical protein
MRYGRPLDGPPNVPELALDTDDFDLDTHLNLDPLKVPYYQPCLDK